jgi:hypothetical protein
MAASARGDSKKIFAHRRGSALRKDLQLRRVINQRNTGGDELMFCVGDW